VGLVRRLERERDAAALKTLKWALTAFFLALAWRRSRPT
jgi:hypothetical protein